VTEAAPDRGARSGEAEAVARAIAAIDIAYVRYASGQEGIAQLLARLRAAREQLSEDVFPGSGRFEPR
jgi:hypothetical protein